MADDSGFRETECTYADNAVMSRPTPTALAPEFVEPMGAKIVNELPVGGWLYELKLDGYRCIAIKHGSSVRLRSRRNKELARDYPSITNAVAQLRAQSAVLDGEIVALD